MSKEILQRIISMYVKSRECHEQTSDAITIRNSGICWLYESFYTYPWDVSYCAIIKDIESGANPLELYALRVSLIKDGSKRVARFSAYCAGVLTLIPPRLTFMTPLRIMLVCSPSILFGSRQQPISLLWVEEEDCSSTTLCACSSNSIGH